ncbi:MAG: sulfate reduction electron transfer complex DsrMKJOP subunit DsrP [Planctomycetota bacterium]|jgi:molybdopterin-containing oxidoreductase family membrane subunit
MKDALNILRQGAVLPLKGNRYYYLWAAFLLGLVVWGTFGYAHQLREGLIVTNMRDSVSWGFYIGNFTFLVGVAAAAVMLVIPAYLYDWKPIKEVVILGESLAIGAIIMCILFVLVDLGRIERSWHLVPLIGVLNFPDSLLSWDILVLNIYLVVNLCIIGLILKASFFGRPYNKRIVVPLILFSIPMAVSIHTVTAFIYNGLPARPFWNASILAPRFLVSAFCSGPAILIVLFQILRHTTKFEIKMEAIWKIAEFVAYAIAINLFLLGAEVFKEFYSGTEHTIFARYLFVGIGKSTFLVPFAWSAVALNLAAFFIFLIPKTRKNIVTLTLGCILVYTGVYIEKGIGFIIPGLTPDPLGQIYVYTPTLTEIQIGAGIFGVGFLVFTVLCKVAIPISIGDFTIRTVRGEGGAADVPATDTAVDDSPAAPAPAPVAEPPTDSPESAPEGA